MKRTLIAIVALSVVTVLGCKKLKSVADIKFGIPYKETVDIQGFQNPGTFPSQGLTLPLPQIALATNSAEALKEYNTSADLVTSVKLGLMKLTMESAGGNFDLVDSLKMYITAPGLSEELAAFEYGIPKGTKTIDMDVVDLNVKEYFLKDSIYLKLVGHFYSAPEENTKLTIETRFDAVANPLGD